MAEELHIGGYYQSVRDQNIIDTNSLVRLGMEFYLSQLLFRGDLSRVVYSREDIAFRRRVETVGSGVGREGMPEYDHLSLNLPYAVYSQEGSYEPDDRPAVMNAGMQVIGQTQPDSGINVKSAAVKIAYTATAFFSRRDDINIASQLLYWERTPKFPLYFIVEHVLAGYPIDIPVFITLESLDSNVSYQEKDWLVKSKIFPLKMEFTVRSYQTLIETVDSGLKLPIRFSGLYGYNDHRIVFTQKTSLIWSDFKWTPDRARELDGRELDGAGNEIHLPQNMDPHWTPPVTEAALRAEGRMFETSILHQEERQVNVVVAHAIEGYFQEDRNCVLDAFFQDDERTTENSIMIGWRVKPADMVHFDNITVYIPGLVRTKIEDVHTEELKIIDLHPASEYDCTLIVTAKDFTKLTYKLTLKTRGDPVLGGTLMSQLVGRTFSNRVLE